MRACGFALLVSAISGGQINGGEIAEEFSFAAIVPRILIVQQSCFSDRLRVLPCAPHSGLLPISPTP